MRLRNVPGSRELIASSPYVVREDSLRSRRGNWRELFGNDHPICLEIGMGKGRFIIDLALGHPEINYIGIEKYSSVLQRAVEKRHELEERQAALGNLYFIRTDAQILPEIFAPGEVSVIYLNFSDPWPKERHAHRRLPGSAFLARFRQVLSPEGRVEFKTDNDALFTFAIDSAKESGWTILESAWDLHHDPRLCAGNVMTEYEERFSAKGNAIHKLIILPS